MVARSLSYTQFRVTGRPTRLQRLRELALRQPVAQRKPHPSTTCDKDCTRQKRTACQPTKHGPAGESTALISARPRADDSLQRAIALTPAPPLDESPRRAPAFRASVPTRPSSGQPASGKLAPARMDDVLSPRVLLVLRPLALEHSYQWIGLPL